jgi:Uri superfamily endonuclease
MYEIPSKKGNYILVFRLEERTRQNIRRFKDVILESGYYLYCGSAHGTGGLKGRISRHLTRSFIKFWHIDYLKECLQPLEVWCQVSSEKIECSFCRFLHFQMGGGIPIKGFGSSDCRNKCESHLIFFHQKTNLDNVFIELNNKYNGIIRIYTHDLL